MMEALNITVLVKNDEKYIFVWDDANRADVLKTVGRFASHPELSLTWYDAAKLAEAVRKTKQAGNVARRFLG